MTATNILIVGNGFDLSHYLPTKYDHFMDVMKAIEDKDLGKPIKDVFKIPVDDFMTLLLKTQQIKLACHEKSYQMSFDELFRECREKEFISKTKEIYHTNSIQLTFEKIIEMQYQLQNNTWYQYFAHHVREVKTWIDFETKINEALTIFANFIIKIDHKLGECGYFSKQICFYGEGIQGQINLTRESCNVLELFKIIKSGYYIDEKNQDELGRFYTDSYDVGCEEIGGEFRFYINDDHILWLSGFSKIKADQILLNIHNQLEEFIEIFNQYLELIVSKLEPKAQFQISAEEWIAPHKIYSFNYTNTYQRLHNSNVVTEYLHGNHGEKQNIVLGISDLEHENLKKLKAYGFTKYHQKLFKDTQYLFLDEYKKIISDKIRAIQILEKSLNIEIQISSNIELINAHKDEINKCTEAQKLNLHFFIWGHSLDVSDQEYIIDIFSLNDNMDRNVRVTVYYFDKTTKFSLLNNLLAILDKDKVEYWMKNKWLKFEPNPEVI